MGAAGDDDTARRRLRMRAWRRGTREMDLILGPFADAMLPGMDAASCAEFEALLDENDQDLYAWVSGRLSGAGTTGPARHAALLDRIARHAADRLRGAAG